MIDEGPGVARLRDCNDALARTAFGALWSDVYKGLGVMYHGPFRRYPGKVWSRC